MPPHFTARQGQFLAFIHRYTERHGIPPSFDDLAAQFGVTSPSVNGMIKTLERNGLISRIPGAARTLRVEVPPELLPEIGFGRSSPRAKVEQRSGGPSAATVAVATATAVLDTLLPALARTGDDLDLTRAVMEAASNAARALERAGVSSEEAGAVARRIGAEATRWRPDGRGVVLHRKVWSPAVGPTTQ